MRLCTRVMITVKNLQTLTSIFTVCVSVSISIFSRSLFFFSPLWIASLWIRHDKEPPDPQRSSNVIWHWSLCLFVLNPLSAFQLNMYAGVGVVLALCILAALIFHVIVGKGNKKTVASGSKRIFSQTNKKISMYHSSSIAMP